MSNPLAGTIKTGYLCDPFSKKITGGTGGGMAPCSFKNLPWSNLWLNHISMSKLHFTTKHANAATVQRNWYVVDGTNQTVGRMCARVASVLRGKNKAYYTPHVDCGDYVIIINADKVKFTGNKMEEKEYLTFSGYPGGLKSEIAKDLLKRRPDALVERAVKGMLPKNRLGRKMIKKLFVYAGSEHQHTAQQPKELKF